MGSHTGQESGMDHPEHTDVVMIGLGPGGEYAAGFIKVIEDALKKLSGVASS